MKHEINCDECLWSYSLCGGRPRCLISNNYVWNGCRKEPCPYEIYDIKIMMELVKEYNNKKE